MPIWIGIVVWIVLLACLPTWSGLILAAETNQHQQTPLTAGQKKSIPSVKLTESVNRAWDTAWKRFYKSETDLFYDYLSSYEPGRELAHLPTAEEVSRQFPNPYGYGTGMEDCMISAGVMMDMICDRYEVTHEEFLRASAHAAFEGMRRCATVPGAPGFVARGVCPENGTGIYVASSRDQFTHCVHGLWRYWHSPLSDAKTQALIREILNGIADRMTRNVTPENNYDFLRADGLPESRGICRMLKVQAHEAARLPMFYAAAWEIGKSEEHWRLYRKYVADAVRQSFDLQRSTPTYALLQMQASLELLATVESDPELKAQMHAAMQLVTRMAAMRAQNADRNAQQLDLTLVGPDWRKSGGLTGEYRKVWYCIRESGEAALSQLMAGREAFDEPQQQLLARALTRLDYGRVSSCGIYPLQGAYWKARKHGLFAKSDAR